MPRVYFTEIQKIQKLWFWVIGFDLLFVGTILTVVLSKTSSAVVEMLPPLILVVIAFSFIIWIFVSSKLITVIDREGIRYRYPVFKPKWKTISQAEIKSFSIKKYDAIFDYGGWGVKNSKKNGKSITIQGDTGLALELKNGDQILIGVQDQENILWAIKRMMTTGSENQ